MVSWQSLGPWSESKESRCLEGLPPWRRRGVVDRDGLGLTAQDRRDFLYGRKDWGGAGTGLGTQVVLCLGVEGTGPAVHTLTLP